MNTFDKKSTACKYIKNFNFTHANSKYGNEETWENLWDTFYVFWPSRGYSGKGFSFVSVLK